MSKASSRNSSIRKILRTIQQGKRFLIATHENPDGDGLGSALALARGLRRLGKKVKVYDRDAVPVSLRFLPAWKSVTSRLSTGERFDATFLVDCAVSSRVGPEFERHQGLGTRIILDHHATSRCGGALHLIEAGAASSGVVVYQLLQKAGVRIDRQIATNIYCTLVTDTGNFCYSNTSAEVLGLARDLVALGARPSEIFQSLQENYPRARLLLLPLVLETLELKGNGRIASVVLTLDMLRKTGATADLAEDFVTFPRSIDSVEVAVLVRETGKERYKVSLRSKEVVDVGAVAARLGGGGHVRAAGFSTTGRLSEVKRTIYHALERNFPAPRRN